MNKEIYVSEKIEHKRYIEYIIDNLHKYFKKDIDTIEINSQGRILLKIIPKHYTLTKNYIIRKIADIVMVGYYYDFIKKNLIVKGLNEMDEEILISAIISADYREYKKYVELKLKNIDNYNIDGFYNFRLQALKNKWQEIVSVIPSYFTKERLQDFLEYLAKDNQDKCFLKENKVFNKNYTLINLSDIIYENNTELKALIDIILLGVKNIELLSMPSKIQYNFLETYYKGTFTNSFK